MGESDVVKYFFFKYSTRFAVGVWENYNWITNIANANMIKFRNV